MWDPSNEGNQPDLNGQLADLQIWTVADWDSKPLLEAKIIRWRIFIFRKMEVVSNHPQIDATNDDCVEKGKR